MKEIRARSLHDRWMRTDPAYRREYRALEGEFALIDAMVQARADAHLTQTQLARRMGTTRAAIARLESGRTKPSTRTLERLAEATGIAAADFVRADWDGVSRRAMRAQSVVDQR